MLPRLKPILQPRTLTQKVHAILRKYGADAHVYLPGIGSVGGIDAGNWLESTGNNLATVDNPVGLALDAPGSLGPELITNGDFSNGTTGWTLAKGASDQFPVVVDGQLNIVVVSGYAIAGQQINSTAGKSYLITGYRAGDSAQVFAGTALNNNSYLNALAPVGLFRYVVTPATDNFWITVGRGAIGTAYIDNISIREVSGIHTTQPTTANKPILRNASNRYYWDFVDATDVLNATFPAGYESVTTIDAAPGGQVTLTAQNIVGTYAITTDTYGRFIFKTITADELIIMQKFANRLVGL